MNFKPFYFSTDLNFNYISQKKIFQSESLLIDLLDSEMLVMLGKNNIKSKNDLADLSSEELLDIVGEKLQGIDEANKVIMKAREDWFKE